MPGVDAEVGYELRDGLVGYVGGYYFGANNVSTVCGPRARVTYDWSLASGRRILGVFDKVGLEAGVQNDKPRGTIAYLSANVRVGWLPQKHEVLQGVSRHMVDPVRRDIDIVSGDNTTQTTYDPIVVKTTTSATEVANVYAQNENVTVIDPAFVISDAEANTIAAAMQTSQSPAILAVTDDLSIAEITGDSTLKGTIRMAREGGITSSGNTILNQPTNNERIRVAENSIVRNEITSTNMDSAVHLFASPAQPILSDASIPITDAQAQPGFVDVDAVDANAELQSTGLSTPDVQSVEGSSGTPNLTEGFVGDKPTEGGSGSSSPAVTDHESLDDGVSVADGLSVSGGAHGTLSTYRNATNLYKALSKDPTIANIILDSDDQDQIDLLAKGFAKGYGKKIRSQFVDSLTAEQAQVFATALANSRDSDVATTTGFVETMRTLKGYIIQ
ncbi:MAG: hypothetical protein ACD_21C00049G0002 [uncultured bacterium]|nr:MAG: hypothetical protein ACD_21C00049G0002 [uncultured bacterium]